jgi:hypothetical protein
VYATPALITLVLLLLETLFLIVALPETRGKRAQVDKKANTNGHADGHKNGHANGNGAAKEVNGKANGAAQLVKAPVEQRLQLLSVLRNLHFLFLGVFSGVEFTLTFLTFDCKYLRCRTLALLILIGLSVRLE